MPRGIVRHVALLTAGLCVLSACGPTVLAPAGGTGIHKIKHVIIIMQENRTFDSYFGRYPGADGLPNANGVFTVCSPDPLTGQCVYPYHDTHDVNGGGPHGQADAVADIDAGKMDGFVAGTKPT
jgi:phospholipase C